MKKIISFLVAAVMVFSVFGMLHVTAPIKAAAESTNLALNKPVTEILTNANAMATYWDVSYLTDGVTVENTGRDAGTGQLEGNHDSWYVAHEGAELEASAVIDLEAVYNICRVELLPGFHFNGEVFPEGYDIYVSEDNATWTLVYSETGRSPGSATHAQVVEFEKVSARYVKVTITKARDVVGDGAAVYAGIGDIEVYDTYLSGDVRSNVAYGKSAIETLGVAGGFTLSSSGAWSVDAVTGGSVSYYYGPFNLLGWIATSYAGWDAAARMTIDLHALYTIDNVTLYPMPWAIDPDTQGAGWFMPNSYDIFVSPDGADWTLVYHGEDEAAMGTAGSVRSIDFDAIDARYVSIAVFHGAAVGDGSFWTGLGEIEVYGTFKGNAPAKPDVAAIKATDLTWIKKISGDPFTINYTEDGVVIQKEDAAAFEAAGHGEDDNAYAYMVLPGPMNPADYPIMVVEAYSAAGGYIAMLYDWPDLAGYLEYPAGITNVPFVAYTRTISMPDMAVMGHGIDLTVKNILFYKSAEAFRKDLTLRGYYAYGLTNYTDFVDVDGTDYTYGVDVPPAAFTSGEVDGDYAQFEGWVGSYAHINGVGYVVDDGEPVFDPSFIVKDAAAIQETAAPIWDATASIRTALGGTGDAIYYNVRFNIEEGEHTVKLVFDLEGYDEYVIYEPTSYSYTDVEYGIKTAQIYVAEALTLHLKVDVPDTVTAPKLQVTDPEGENVVLDPVEHIAGHYYFDYSGIYPQKMADEFTLTILDGDALYAGAAVKTYSVVEYADTLYNTSAADLRYSEHHKAELDTLLADMLTFGAASQVYKNYNVDDLADELEWVQEAKTTAVPEPVDVKAVLSSSEGDFFKGATIAFDDVIRLKVRFKATDAVAIRFDAGGGYFTVNASEWTPVGTQFFAFSEPQLIYQLMDPVTVELLDANNTVLAAITYSYESYIASGAIGAENSYFTDALLIWGRSAYEFAYGP